MTYCYEYPHPAVAVDMAVFTLIDGALNILLIERKDDPFAGRWALPGGFVQMEETVDQAALRELAEETGVSFAARQEPNGAKWGAPKLVGLYSNPKRDPRERVISVAYLACMRAADVSLAAGSDASAAQWRPMPVHDDLAFDHADIIRDAHAALRANAIESPLAARMLPPTFTLSELLGAAQIVLGSGAELDKRNFYRLLKQRMSEATAETPFWLEAANEIRSGGRHRPAQLFKIHT